MVSLQGSVICKYTTWGYKRLKIYFLGERYLILNKMLHIHVYLHFLDPTRYDKNVILNNIQFPGPSEIV